MSMMAKALKQYRQQRSSAKRRGVGFSLTFSEWWAIWEKSGVHHLRGPDGFVMHRINDEGPYEVGNVQIVSADENFRRAMDIYYCGDRNYL